MPITTVEAPNGKFIDVEAPAGASEQDILFYAAQQFASDPSIAYSPEDDTTLLGSVGEFGKRALGGVATGAVSTVTGLGQLIPGLDDEALVEADMSFREGVAETLGYDPAYDENYGAQLGQVVGEMVPMVASALYTGPLSLLARTAAVTGPALSEGSFDRKEFEDRTGEKLSDYERLTSKGADVALGQLERFGISTRIIRGLPRGFFKTDSPIAERIASMVAGGLREGVQEVGQGIARDISTLAIYDPDRKIADSAVDDFTLGGGAGAIFDLLIGLAQSPLRRRGARTPDEIGDLTPEQVAAEEQARAGFDAEEQRRRARLDDTLDARDIGPQPEVRPDPIDPTTIDPSLPVEEMADQVVTRLGSRLPINAAFTVGSTDNKFYAEIDGEQVGPALEDPLVVQELANRLTETSRRLGKDAEVEYIVENSGLEYTEQQAAEVRNLGRAIPSPQERVIRAEDANEAVGRDIASVINNQRVDRGEAETEVFTLEEVRAANKGDVGRLGDVLAEKDADFLAFRDDQPVQQAPLSPTQPRQPALGRRQQALSALSASFDNEISSERAFADLFAAKRMDLSVNSEAFRGLVKRIIGKTPSKKNPLDKLSANERRYLYHRIRKLPSFQEQATQIPDFSTKTPNGELVRIARRQIEADQPTRLAVEAAEFGRTGRVPSEAEVRRVESEARRTAQPIERAGQQVPEGQQIVEYDPDTSALGQQLRDALKSFGIDDTFATKMVDAVGKARRDTAGNLYLDYDRKAKGVRGSAQYGAKLIQVSMDQVRRDVAERGLSYDQAVAEVMNHEIVHAMRAMDLFTPQEWSLLERLTRKQSKTGEADNISYANWAVKTYDNLTQAGDAVAVQEEAIAELISDMLSGKLKLGGKPRNFVQKIADFFKKILGFAEKNDIKSFEQLVSDIQSGAVGRRERGVVRTAFRTERQGRQVEERLITIQDLSTTIDGLPAKFRSGLQRAESDLQGQGLQDAPILIDDELLDGDQVDEAAFSRRLEAAEEQGFDISTVYYHGTGTRNRPVFLPGDGPFSTITRTINGVERELVVYTEAEKSRQVIIQEPPIDKFDPSRRAEEHIDMPLAFGLIAGHFTESPAFAAKFAKMDKLGVKKRDKDRPSSTIYPVYLRFGEDNSQGGLFAYHEADRDGALQVLLDIVEAPLKSSPGLMRDMSSYYAMEINALIKNPSRSSLKATTMSGPKLFEQVLSGDLSVDAAARQLAEIYHRRQAPIDLETLIEEPDAIGFGELERMAPYIKEAGYVGYRDIEYDGGPYTGIAMFNPGDIKGIFAKFDPASVPEGAAYDDDIMYSRRNNLPVIKKSLLIPEEARKQAQKAINGTGSATEGQISAALELMGDQFPGLNQRQRSALLGKWGDEFKLLSDRVESRLSKGLNADRATNTLDRLLIGREIEQQVFDETGRVNFGDKYISVRDVLPDNSNRASIEGINRKLQEIKRLDREYEASPKGRAEKLGMRLVGDEPMYSRRSVGKPLTKALERAKQKYSDVRIASEEEFFKVFWNNLIQEVGGTVAPKKLRVAGRRAVSDIKEWVKKNPKYNDYYTEDLKAMRMSLEAEYGKLADEEVLLYQFLLGATSPQTELQLNVEEGLRLFDLYRRNGNFDSFRLGKSEKGNAIVADGPFVFVGSSGPNKARAVKALDKVVRSQGGLKQALDYMLQPVSMKELESFKKSLGYTGLAKKGEIKGLVKEATGQDELIPRVFFMGPKLGAYTINLMGDTRFQTVDVWEARFIRSYFDNMFDVNTGITANADEATLFRDFGRVFAEEFEKIVGYKTDAATLQAMRWFYMINAAKEAGYKGANTNETISELTQRKIEETGGSRYGGRTASAVENPQGADGAAYSRRGSADSPEYGRTVQGGLRPDGRLALTHYSNRPITRTDPQKAGSGADIRKRNRPTVGTWFGVTEAEESPYVRESVVGTVPSKFAIEPSRLYVIADYKNPDAEQDPLGVWTQDPTGRVDYDAILEKVSAAGFDGFLINAPALGKVALVTKPLEAVDDAMASRRVSGDRLERTRDRARRLQARGLEALEGAPIISGATGPDPYLNAVAEEYAEEFGIPIQRQPSYVEIDERFAKQLADAYEAMEHNPSDPAVAEAYQDLVRQTKDQYNFLVDAGYSFTFFDSETDPYDGNPWNAMRDLRNNRTMAVYGTYDGYGTDGITAKDVEENPMLAATGLFWNDQNGQAQPVTINDLFRAVHDALGHGLEGAGFRARGEENAWQAHSRLFTGPALAALTTETRGQNSWLNFGPHGRSNQTAALEDTVFADQKLGLLPSWAWAKSSAPASKKVDTETLSRRSVASQQEIDEAVELTRQEVNTTQGPPRFSTKASPEAQYIARNPGRGIDEDTPAYSRVRSSSEAESVMDRITRGPDQEAPPGQVFMAATDTGPIGAYLTRLKAAAIDRYAALGKYYQKVPGLRELEADSSAIAAALFSDRAKGILASAVKYGVPVYRNGLTKVEDFSHNGENYRGLIGVMSLIHNKDVGDLRKQAQAYAMAIRSQELRSRGKQTPVSARDADIIFRDVEQFTDANGYNPIKKWHDVWQAYNSKTIDFLKATGILNEETADIWKDSSYIPFYRSGEDQSLPAPAKNVFGDMTRMSEFKSYKGSEKGVDVGLVESVILNLSAAVEMGMKNVAQQRIARDMQSIGLARQVSRKAKINNGIKFKVDGKEVHFQIDDNLIFDSMVSLSDGLGVNFLTKYLGMPSNALRELVTRDPGFMVANLFRDTISTFTTSGANFTPVIGSLKGLSDGIENLEKLGVVGGYDFSIDNKDIVKFYKEESRRRGVNGMPLNMFKTMWDALGQATTRSDAATRNAVYKDVLARTGNEAEAAFQAMEIINFSRRGAHPLARILTAAIPFLNARFQGLDVFARAAMGNYTTNKELTPGQIQFKFLTRGALLAGLTAMYYVLVSDDEQYKEQPDEVRENNWLIPTAMGVPVTLPIPFEVGLLFKTIPEVILDRSIGDRSDREVREALQRGVMSTLEINPFGMQFAAPFVEAWLNHSFFTGKPVVPVYLNQSGSMTPGLVDRLGVTELSKDIGEALNINPIKIDHVIHGYAGTLGGYGIAVADAIYKTLTVDSDKDRPPSRNVFEFPLWRRFFGSKEGSGRRADAYELFNDVKEVVTTINDLKRNGRVEELEAYLAARQHILALKSPVYAIKRVLDKARQEKNIIASADMDPDLKRQMRDEIDAKINEYLTIIPKLKELRDAPFIQGTY